MGDAGGGYEAPVSDSPLFERLVQWRCRAVGCDWERRKAYDYCRHCRAARWHIAARTASTDVPSGSLTLVDRGRSAAGGWVQAVQGLLDLDWEGSELFVDPADLAEAA